MNLISVLFLRYAVQYVNITDLLLLHLIFAVHMKTCEFNKTVCRFSYLWDPPGSVHTTTRTRWVRQSGSRRDWIRLNGATFGPEQLKSALKSKSIFGQMLS